MKSSFVNDDFGLFWQCPLCGNNNSHMSKNMDSSVDIAFTVRCESCGCTESYEIHEHKGVVNLLRTIDWTSMK